MGCGVPCPCTVPLKDFIFCMMGGGGGSLCHNRGSRRHEDLLRACCARPGGFVCNVCIVCYLGIINVPDLSLFIAELPATSSISSLELATEGLQKSLVYTMNVQCHPPSPTSATQRSQSKMLCASRFLSKAWPSRHEREHEMQMKCMHAEGTPSSMQSRLALLSLAGQSLSLQCRRP